MEDLIIFIVAVVITESLTELIAKSEIFSPVREWFFNKRGIRMFKFIHSLLDCGYCLSVWVGFFIGLVLVDLHLLNSFIDCFIVGLLLHRTSNILHNIIDRTRAK